MKKFILKGAFSLVIACLAGGMMTSCSDDDDKYENVQPPVIEPVKKVTINGVVTAMSGKPIADATVTATLGSSTATATTNAQGVYLIENLEQNGTFKMKVTASGKVDREGELEVAAGEIGVWSAQLINEGQEVAVSATEETVVEVTTEAFKDNKEAEVTVVTVIPAAAVNDASATVTITPIYSDDDIVDTKAKSEEEILVVGVDVACSNPAAKLVTPITLTYQLGEEMAKAVKGQKFVSGSWKDVQIEVKDGNVIIYADEFASYRLPLLVTVNTTESKEDISFTQKEYDNLFGSKDMEIAGVEYIFKQGAEVTVNANGKMAAYLLDILGRKLGTATLATAKGIYPINVVLPIGTAMTLSGKQDVTSISVGAGGVTVTGKSYGNVIVNATTYNREHTGGGSGTI